MKILKKLPILKLKKNQKKNEEDLFNIPIKNIEDLIEDFDGRFKLIANITPINGELMEINELSEVSEAISSALASFDGRIGIYIQSQRIDIESNLKYMEEHKKTLNELKSMILDEEIKYLKSMTGKSRNVLNFYMVLETKQKNIEIAKEILTEAFNTIKNELEGQDMVAEHLLKKEIMQLLYEKMNPEQSQVEPIRDDWTIDNILPQNVRKFSDGRKLEIENDIYRFFSITKYPQTVDKYRWLRRIFTIRGNINIAIILTPKNKGTIQKELSDGAKEVRAKARLNEGDPALSQEYMSEYESAIEMISELGSDNVTLYNVNITISISEKNEEKLNTLANSLRAKISSCYCQTTEIKYKEFEPFFTILPILADNKITRNYIWNFSNKDIGSIIPFDSSELMEKEGTLIAENVTSNGLVILDYYNKIYNNPHLAIIADSGSGKTFFIMVDAIRQAPYMDYIIMFDVDGNLKFPWATKYKFSATSGVISNPFHIRNAIQNEILKDDIDSENEKEDSSSVGDFLATKIMDCIIFFKWILTDMTSYEEALLEEDIRDTYDRCGLTFESTKLPEVFPTLSDLEKTLKAKIEDENKSLKSRDVRENMLAALNPYINGAYSKIFNGQTNWEYRHHTIFDISMVSDTVKKPLYEILLKDSWQFFKKDGVINPPRKRIYIDEAHEFADPNNPQTLGFLSTKLIKQGRKYGVSVVTATQNLPDFLSIKRYGQAILDNSFFKIFFRVGETDLPEVKKLYSFSNNELKILSSTNRKGSKGKGILCVGSRRVEIQTKASKYELEIIDPKQYFELFNEPSRYY